MKNVSLSFCDWLGEETEYIYDSALETKEERDSRIIASSCEGQKKVGFRRRRGQGGIHGQGDKHAFDYYLKLRFGHLNDDDKSPSHNMTVTYGEGRSTGKRLR